MITKLMVACALMAWEPGENAVTHDVYEDMIFAETVLEPKMQICRRGYQVPVSFYVVAVDGAKRSVPSGTLTVKWTFNFDVDGSGLVSFANFGDFTRAFGKRDPLFDADEGGVVGWPDFGRFVARFGECNDGKRVVPCP